MDIIYNIAIIVFALIGFLSAYSIFRVKQHEQYGKCTSSCKKVITSRFSHFFGIDTEKLGMLYFALIFIFFFLNILFPLSEKALFFFLILTLFAFLFTLHLVFVQLMVLKKWCTVCLWSSASSFMIMVLAFLGYHYSFGYQLFEARDVLTWVFLFSVFVGIISTSLYARTFMQFMRDFTISRKEDRRLSMFSHMAWVAVTITVLSGVALVLTDVYGEITEASKFWVLATVVVMLFLYEVVLNHFVLPRLVDMHFEEKLDTKHHTHSFLRKTAFSFLLVGIVSWYYLLLLSVFSFHGFSSLTIFIIYFVLVLASVGVALYLEHLYYTILHYGEKKEEQESA